MNPSTTKKTKKNSKHIPMPKTQITKQSDINKDKLQELNMSQLPTEIKQEQKKSQQNLNFEKVNQQNIKTKTEIKDKKRKVCNSQTLLCNLKDEINNEKNQEKSKPNENKIKNNNNKIKNVSNKNVLSESNSDFFKDKDSEDIKESSCKQILKSQNVVIKTKLNLFNNFNIGEEKINSKVNSPQTKRQLTGKIKQIKKNNNKENINQSKTAMTKTNKDDNINELLISDNEFDESKNSSKIKKTKFLKVSTNPFTTKIAKKSLNLNMPSSKNISDLKKQLNKDNNINNNNVNTNPENKENIDHFHHMKSTKFNIRYNISQTTIPNLSNMSSGVINMQNMNSNSKKTLNTNTNTNTDISEHSNIENIYRKFLFLAKRGDREKFLEILGQILSLDKNNRDINYKDENGYSALHYACEEGNLKIVEILIDTHCNPNILNNLKQTPLHLSAKGGYFDISKKLIESGAILNIYDSEKNSPLHYICKNNYVELLKYFLTKSPRIEEKNIYGKTPKDLTTNLEIKNLLDDYINKMEKESKTSKISSNEASDLLLRTKSQNTDIKNLRNSLTTNINGNKTINPQHSNNPLKYHKSKSDLVNQNKEKQDFEMKSKNKKHSHKNNLISASTNLKIELNTNNVLNNSSNTSNNKSPSPDSTNKEKICNKNCVLKKEIRNKEKSLDNSLTNIRKEKKDSNIYVHNTNNIHNNNININIYSIEGIKRNATNTNYIGSRSINKERGYITIDESNLNNSKDMNINNSVINKSSTTIKSKLAKKKNARAIHVSQTKNEGKSKFYQNNVKNILDSIDTCDKNIFNLNKTEENIITNKKKINIKISKDKNDKAILNNSANIHYISNNNNNKKSKVLTNNSKLIQLTEQLLTKVKPQQKKKESKFKRAIKNVNDSVLNNMNLSKISPLKKNKPISDIDLINRSNILLPHKKILNTTMTSIEHITTSNFVCLAQLGKGSFGEVYLVKKVNSEETYAMKVLRKERIMGQNLLKYAIAERNVLSTSHHPFIVKLNYAFQTSTKLFLVIEYCPNGDLAKHLSFEKRFKEPRAKFYICEILLALEDLHKRDIIFRDLKPDNVVLDKDGHCKLTDFGLSKEGVHENFFAQSFCGSIAYLAPEMLKKEGHGKAVDWYLLGVLFYEMLVGITPYFTTRKEDIFYNIEHGELKIPDFVSKEAGELLRRLLERNPNKRLGGMGRDALEIKEHPYFKDVDWKKMYEKKIKAPNFVNYMDKTIKYYRKPRLFANDDFLNKTEDDKHINNILHGWSFISKDDII